MLKGIEIPRVVFLSGPGPLSFLLTEFFYEKLKIKS